MSLQQVGKLVSADWRISIGPDNLTVKRMIKTKRHWI